MNSILRLPLVVWIGLTLISYLSILVSPGIFKYSGLISFTIPVFILINLFLTLLSVIFKWKLGWITLILTLAAYPFYQVALAYKVPSGQKEQDLTVLNYNVKWFTDARQENYGEVIEWINQTDADILCFQEYYPLKDIGQRIKSGGNYYESMDEEAFHVAIYSKYPIVDEGLVFADDRLNNIRFADIKIKTDTIRVYSVHLQSMGINPDLIQDSEGIKSEYENITNRFVNGSRGRTEQLNSLLEHIDTCKFPVILAGDFNDVPFSYNYFRMRGVLKNTFEAAGSGFGITYNGKIPYLRIDNQFYSEGLEALSFSTLNDIKYSDHFPLVGKYRITE